MVDTTIPRDVQGPARSDDRETVLRRPLVLTAPAASSIFTVPSIAVVTSIVEA